MDNVRGMKKVSPQSEVDAQALFHIPWLCKTLGHTSISIDLFKQFVCSALLENDDLRALSFGSPLFAPVVKVIYTMKILKTATDRPEQSVKGISYCSRITHRSCSLISLNCSSLPASF